MTMMLMLMLTNQNTNLDILNQIESHTTIRNVPQDARLAPRNCFDVNQFEDAYRIRELHHVEVE